MTSGTADLISKIKLQLHLVEAKLKEMNTVIAQLERMGTSPESLKPIREERDLYEKELALLVRMLQASIPLSSETKVESHGFTQRVVATTRSIVPEVQARIKELQISGILKGRKRLPLPDCYDLIQNNPNTHSVVAEQFWQQVNKSSVDGECWLVKEPFKINSLKKNLVRCVYIPALGCKIPAVRLCCILEGMDVKDDKTLRNSCGNPQCIRPTHNDQQRKKPKLKKDKPVGSMPTMAPEKAQEEYTSYIFELLQDQEWDKKANEGISFRDAERILVTERKDIPDKDSMIKAIRFEKAGNKRFHLAENGKLYLTGFPFFPPEESPLKSLQHMEKVKGKYTEECEGSYPVIGEF
jgi:hypothetical protein